MALKIDTNQSATAYHVIDGATLFSYAIDAQSAISRFPNEWSASPWPFEDTAAARQAAGGPAPEPLTPEEQAAIDDHAKAVAAANERLAAFRKKRAEEQAVADQVAADEALVASPPPRPDPAGRRPLSPAKAKREEFLKLTPEEQAEADRRIGVAAADDKIAQDKADADKLAGNTPTAATQ